MIVFIINTEHKAFTEEIGDLLGREIDHSNYLPVKKFFFFIVVGDLR
jgi:hypothetical protein